MGKSQKFANSEKSEYIVFSSHQELPLSSIEEETQFRQNGQVEDFFLSQDDCQTFFSKLI